ncbi:MAG TPA: AI-2E family transporter [Candidatus Kryptonia bacterium]|nr:AI-2E family transporter [Candidatus Kryptonia bacterium]
MTRQQLFAAFFFAALLYLLFQFYVIFSVFLGPLSWAALLALVFYPINARLVSLARGRETLVAFGLTTVVIAVVIVPTILISALLASESVALYQRLQEFITSGQMPGLLERTLTWLHESRVGQLWDRMAPQISAWNINFGATALKFGDAISSFLVAQATGIAKNALRFVVNFFLTTFALFFFFRDGERLISGLRELIPMAPEHKNAVFGRLYDTLSAVVQGTLATAAAQGTLAGLGFWALGVPFAVILGCATAFLSLLPMGAVLVWAGVVIYFLANGAFVRAVLMLIWGIVGISGVDNVIRPLIIGGRAQIPTAFLFFGILGGLQAYGFLGLFLAPAVIAILFAFIRIYQELYAVDLPAPQ